MKHIAFAGFVWGAVSVVCCGGSTQSAPQGVAPDSGVVEEGGMMALDGSHGDDADGSPVIDTGGPPPPYHHLCSDPPQGTGAAALPTYAGQCPTIQPAPAENMITSSGNPREFMVVVPSPPPAKGEKLPVIFAWHWLGGDANAFLTKGDLQNAVNQERFLAVIPERKMNGGASCYTPTGPSGSCSSAYTFRWPATNIDAQSARDEEYQFFDDMLACVAAQFPGVDKDCVSSAGVSAGALFTDQLAAARSDRLASFISLSGGTGGVAIPNWGNPPHKLPGLVLWGGPMDQCGVGPLVLNFQTESQQLEQQLAPGGDFVVECIHNCGHGVPPMMAPNGESPFTFLWDFAMDHPFWLGAGQSPYIKDGLPVAAPSWCAIGAGNATIRVGACPPPGC